ncbi:hypothetical protein Pst134EB_012716 [Puccinia striiformis f. sp. tritici]|uniref:Ubiquitin-like domain-containing protein n=1 Tax=Puccinia striiformis f. sp. tritici PST-78 TaxID=1165861 RepID=A0A0L0VV08_9BASI|nr:hypothetical protein Pst134EB_012716 [Puccinia striiformis f. sp. tritici]KNF03134.1 hypothetical protein PSTG_03719 [Puccinia striiformis f. sp. tritici PST-78]
MADINSQIEKSEPERTESAAPAIEINNGEALSISNSIKILLIKPSMMESTIGPSEAQQTDQIVQIHSTKTKVQDIKTHISSTWRGKPKTDGIRLIARGRIINDPESVGEALDKLPEDPSSPHPIHVVIRPNAWTEKLTLAPPRPVSAPPTATTHPPVSSTDPIPTSTPNSQPSNLRPVSQPFPNLTSPTNISGENAPTTSPRLGSSPPTNGSGLPNNLSTPAQLFNSYFSGLTAYGRINFIQNILQAQFTVVERLDSIRRQLHNQHLKLLGIDNHALSQNPIIDPIQAEQSHKEWKRIEGKLVNLLADLKFPASYTALPGSVPPEPLQTEFDPLLPDECSEFKRVEIAGLPYLLYIPESVSQQNPKDGSNGTSSPLKEYKQLQRELNRTLRLEAQVQYLVLQAQKTQANLNQMDEIISAGLRPTDTLGGDREAQQVQRIFDGLFPPNAFPFPRPPPGLGAGAGGLGLGLGLGPAADGLHPPNNFMLPNVPLWQHPMARVRRYEFTINLDSIRRYMAPLLWLSLKLSVLLYIFGRHASYGKLVILIMIASGWVIWEAYTIYQRHDAQARRRDRLQRGQQAAPAGGADARVDPIQAVLDRGRRRAERERLQQLLRDQRQRVDGILGIANQEAGVVAPANNNNNNNNPQPAPAVAPAQPAPPAGPPIPAQAPVANPPPPPPPAAAPAPAPAPRRNAGRGGLRAAAADIRARGGAFPPGTEVRPFRSTSAFSPKYWFNSIAVVGLASEYRELGLHSIGERAMGASNLEYPRWYRYLRNSKTCLVLFLGTLLPEIEKKRKKALEKRARILNLVIADAARDVNNPNRNLQPPQPAQQPRVVAPAAVGTNNIGTTTPPQVPTAPAGQTVNGGPGTPNAGTVTTGEDQQTPRALAATALERAGSTSSQQTLSQRRPHLAVASAGETGDESSLLMRGISTTDLLTESATLDKLPVTDTIPPTTDPSSSSPSSTSVDAAAFAPTQSSSSALVTQQPPQEAENQGQEATVIDHDNPPLQSPLTPLEHPQVVGGLDDTDDEEIIGAENDEAGMLLF